MPYNVKIDDLITIDLEVKEDIPFEIIYEDNEILIVKKRAGLLTIGTVGENEKTLYHMVREYANKNKYRLFIINRLDRETSGIVMFAKNERIKMLYQDNWNELVTKRGYIAIVEGNISKDGRIENLLYEEKNTFVHSSKIGKKAITNYKVLKTNDKYTLLDIHIDTGRKNQIRVHMSEMGNPIVGDKKYGSLVQQERGTNLALCSYRLQFTHPVTKKEMDFSIQPRNPSILDLYHYVTAN